MLKKERHKQPPNQLALQDGSRLSRAAQAAQAGPWVHFWQTNKPSMDGGWNGQPAGAATRRQLQNPGSSKGVPEDVRGRGGSVVEAGGGDGRGEGSEGGMVIF